MAQPAYRTPPEEQGVTTRLVDDIEIDWPRSAGFFGAIGAAVAFELVPIPIAMFIASVPFLKLMNRPNAPKPVRFFSQIVEGAAKPVGGDGEGTIHWAGTDEGPGARREQPSSRVGRSPARRSRGGRR